MVYPITWYAWYTLPYNACGTTGPCRRGGAWAARAPGLSCTRSTRLCGSTSTRWTTPSWWPAPSPQVRGDLARGAGPCATRAARPDCLCARRRARATPDCYGSAGCVRRRRLARVPSLVPRRAPWVSSAAPASALRRTCRCGRVPAARCRSRPHSARALCDGAHVGGAARSRSRRNATDRALPATHGRPGRHPAPGQQPAGRRVRGDPASDAPSSQVAPRPRRGPQGGVGVRRRLSAACCSAARQARLPAGVPAATAPCAPPPLQRPATRERARRHAGG